MFTYFYSYTQEAFTINEKESEISFLVDASLTADEIDTYLDKQIEENMPLDLYNEKMHEAHEEMNNTALPY